MTTYFKGGRYTKGMRVSVGGWMDANELETPTRLRYAESNKLFSKQSKIINILAWVRVFTRPPCVYSQRVADESTNIPSATQSTMQHSSMGGCQTSNCSGKQISHHRHCAAAYSPQNYRLTENHLKPICYDTFQSCPWVHFTWPNLTQPIAWLTQPNPTQRNGTTES